MGLIAENYSTSPMSDPAEQPTFEVAHFACNADTLRTSSVKYIVTQTPQQLFQLFADSRWLSHEYLLDDMRKKGLVPEDAKTLGGGIILIRNSIFNLEDYSRDYGQEPHEVRKAFIPLVGAKLLGMELEVTPYSRPQ